jgi:molybdopterin molybdotransferase
MTLICPEWHEARRAAHASGDILSTQVIALRAGDRRVLAERVHARTALPPRDAAAMDGWAVCGAGPWSVIAQVLAGAVPDTVLTPGKAVTIATGAELPANTSGILRTEHGHVADTGLLVGDVREGQDIRLSGKEAEVDALLIPAGTLLTPGHLGLAAAAGYDEIRVVRKPTARYLVFGDELLRSGRARDGKVRDSLGQQVPAWLNRLGVDVVDVAWVADTLAAHVDALGEGTDVDVVVTSGGTACGPVDYLRQGLALASGSLVVDTVAIRPGHPMLLGRWAEPRWLLGLPGNPQAAIAALLTLGSPLLAALQGRPLPVLGQRRLSGFAGSQGTVTRLVACTSSGGEATPTAHLGSGMLRGLSSADGYAVVAPAGATTAEHVPWLALPC